MNYGVSGVKQSDFRQRSSQSSIHLESVGVGVQHKVSRIPPCFYNLDYPIWAWASKEVVVLVRLRLQDDNQSVWLPSFQICQIAGDSRYASRSYRNRIGERPVGDEKGPDWGLVDLCNLLHGDSSGRPNI
jgi:hypothetical protein